MNCNDVVELTPLYICGDLDARRAAEFDAHLKACPACMLELEQHARLDARLREVVLSEGVNASRVDRRVRELIAAGVQADLPPRARKTPRRWLVAAMGIAAVLLLLLVGYAAFMGAHVGQVYADAAADHQHEVIEQRPRKWFVDTAQIQALAQGQGIEGVVPAALAPENYHLQSAKLCSLDRRVFLHLVYSDGAKEFSLYLRPRDAVPLPGRVLETANGRVLRVGNAGEQHIASFETDRLTAMVVTNESADTALRLARSLSATL